MNAIFEFVPSLMVAIIFTLIGVGVAKVIVNLIRKLMPNLHKNVNLAVWAFIVSIVLWKFSLPTLGIRL